MIAALLCAVAVQASPVGPPAGIAGRLVNHYGMQLVPQEGVWFSLTYRSEDDIDGAALAPRYEGRAHAAGNAIVALATTRDFSALHRLQSDEIWHYYGGAPLEMLLLFPDGHGRRVTLGRHVLQGEVAQITVPHGVWQGATPRGGPGAYSLFGTQLSPAFDAADFTLARRDDLQQRYPGFARDIARLTRP